jgi:hypothetical protein
MSVIGGCVWSDVPKDAVYACSDGAACPEGQACRNGFCFAMQVLPPADACTPITCQLRGASCGPLSDGCGAILDCGKCQGFDVCGGGADGGSANRCGCSPLSAADICQIAGKSCGSVTRFNGCGVMTTVSCGPACAADGGCAGETLSELCANAKYTCGPLGLKDRCGEQRLVDCGNCLPGNTCYIDDEIGDGGLRSACGACEPESDGTLCNRLGASCGELPAPVVDNCGAKRLPNCGECLSEDGGNACGALGGGVDNVCGCQRPLSGCLVDEQCCTGSTCGGNGMCCVAAGYPCSDDSDCCAGHCVGQASGGAVCAVIASTP